MTTSGCSTPSVFSSIAKGALVEWLRLGQPALRLIQRGQAVEARGNFGIAAGQRLFPHFKRALVQGLGLGQPALLLIKQSQPSPPVGCFAMLFTFRARVSSTDL